MYSNAIRSIHDVFPNNPDTLEFHRKTGEIYYIAAGSTPSGRFKFAVATVEGQVLKISEEDYESSSDALHVGMKEAQNIRQ